MLQLNRLVAQLAYMTFVPIRLLRRLSLYLLCTMTLISRTHEFQFMKVLVGNVGLPQLKASSGFTAALWKRAHTWTICAVFSSACFLYSNFVSLSCMFSFIAFIGLSFILYILYSLMYICASFKLWWILTFKLISELKWCQAGVVQLLDSHHTH